MDNAFSAMLRQAAIPALGCAALLFSAPAGAQTPPCRPAIVYHTSREALKEEQSINQAAALGMERAKREWNAASREYFAPPGSDIAAALRQSVADGATVVIALGFQSGEMLPQVAETAPQVRFVLIDGMAPPLGENISSIAFKDHEGAFLAGMVAALQSRTHNVGFIGGMDVAVIRNFAYGFLQGAHYADEEVKVYQTMLGATEAAWNDSAKAQEAAARQIAEGADVLFAAAGAASTAVLETARKEKVWAVASDIDRNAAYPGTVLASVVKRVDQAVADTIRRACGGTLEGGIISLGVREGAIDVVTQGASLAPETRQALEKAKMLIQREALAVLPYMPDQR